MADSEIIENISQHYLLKIYQAFNHDHRSPAILESLIRVLMRLFRHFEPAFFTGKLYVLKSFNDEVLFTQEGEPIQFDKNILLTKNQELLVIQTFSDGRLILWENLDISEMLERSDVLTYLFDRDREFFIAQGETIDVTSVPYGSRYATQYFDLSQALKDYRDHRVLRTSCQLLAEAWFDDNRIFFRGGGKDLPEKHIQISLYQFLQTNISLRGMNVVLREFNVIDETPKPVDLLISWNEANRVALIEIKWLGKSKGTEGRISTEYTNSRGNEGLKQLKDYLDTAQKNMPVSIMKAYLVVFDGRRRATNDDTVNIPTPEGMHYQAIELEIADDRKYYDSIRGFEKPVRMFAAPICL